MENAIIISGLVTRRAELLADLTTAQERVQQLHHDIASMDAVIRQFDPGYNVGSIRPKYRKAPVAAEYASMSRSVLDTMRRAGVPLTVNEIADKVMAERGLNAFDRGMARNMRKRVGMALRYQRTNGMAAETQAENGGVLWAVGGA